MSKENVNSYLINLSASTHKINEIAISFIFLRNHCWCLLLLTEFRYAGEILKT